MELLEREPYLVVLEAALAEAGAGAGRVALVSGEAGIGKTSLVERFIRGHQNVMRVWWGECDSLFTPRPLGPLHDMAAQIGGSLPELLRSDAPPAAVFPSLLGELQRRPAILVVEDVHWADEATLDLLRYIGRRIKQTSALLILTYRDDELGPRHPLRTLLGDLVSLPVVHRFQLPPLSENAVRDLVGARGIDAAALHHLTGGNPFFVTEVLAGQTAGIPNTVRDVVLARAARLSASGYAVLEAAAVIGLSIEPWLLAQVTGAEAGAAEESVAAGLLLAQKGELAFRHALVHQTILEIISPQRSLVLNRLVLDALRHSLVALHEPARLAYHAQAAGDQQAVLEYAPLAARRAAAAGAHRAAATYFAYALQVAGDLPPAERAQMLDEYSVACDVTDRRPEAIAARRSAAELWRQAGNLLKHGESLGHLALLLHLIGEKAEAERVSQASVAVLEALPPHWELEIVYNTQALLYLANLENAKAIAVAEKAIALAERLADNPRLPRLYETLGLCWLYVDYARGCEYLEQSLAYAHRLGQVIRAANTLANLGSIYVEFYQHQRAEQTILAGLNFIAEHDLESMRVYLQGWQAILYVQLGRWDAAAEIAGEVLQHPDPSPGRGPALTALGRLHARRGDPGAEAALAEALEILIKLGYRQREGLIRAALAEAAWLAGDRARALKEARAGYDLALSNNHPWSVGELAYWRWRAGDKVSLPEWAAGPFALHIAGDWRGAAQAWEQLGCPYEQARALAGGDMPAQIAALEIFERLGAQPAAAAVRQNLRAAGAIRLPRKPRASTRDNPFGLTGRQVEILALLVEDLSNAEIAARLHISLKTADHHVSAILAKLDVHSRQAAAALAGQHPHFQKK